MKTVQTLEDKALVRIYRKDLTVSISQCHSMMSPEYARGYTVSRGQSEWVNHFLFAK
jgi:hypothetical protein